VNNSGPNPEKQRYIPLSSQIADTNQLYELARILSHQTDFDEVVRMVASHSAKLLHADLAIILMINPDTRDTIKTIFKNGKFEKGEEHRVIHTNIGGWILNYNKPFFSQNIHKDERFSEGIFEDITIQSVIGVPLIVEDIIIGTLILLYNNSSGQAEKDAVPLLENIAAISTPYLRNVQKIREYFDTTMSESTLIQKYQSLGLLGKSAGFIEMLHAVEAVTKCNVRVLLDGKTGTGKELIARAIHRFSDRAEGPFIATDCGAIPATLMESELFGHTRGAFTGANSERQGLFLEADGGTLFMDEINNLPLELQAKLLRVLQESEFRPLGSDKVVKTNMRIITASSISLKQLVKENMFREDLYFRLHVYPIYIPELKERQEDISLIARHFLEKYAGQQNKKAADFHEEVIDFMKQRIWSGNIRELENFVERLVTLASTDSLVIDPAVFPADLLIELENYRIEIRSRKKSKPIKEQVDEYEAELIKKALENCDWNQSKAARELGTSESNLRYKIKQFNIQKK